MKKYLHIVRDALLDTLFPKTTKNNRAMRLKRDNSPLPLTGAMRSYNTRSVTILSEYSNPRIRDAICSLKFERNMHAATLLGALLDDFLTEHLAEKIMFGHAQTICIPIPLSRERLRERGFNQVETVLNHTSATRSKKLAIVLALIRARDTKAQTTLAREDREENVRDAFRVNTDYVDKLCGASVLLIDDVVATGSTLSEAALVLEKAGATVECLTLAG